MDISPSVSADLDALSEASTISSGRLLQCGDKPRARSHPPCEVTIQRSVRRMVDRGVKTFRADVSCLLLGQSSWYWGLALNQGDWSGIYMLASDYEARRTNPFWHSVAKQLEPKLHLVPSINFILGRGLISLVLIEGDPTYLGSTLPHIPSDWPVLMLLPAGWSRPSIPDVHWLAVSHTRCGGVTTARVNIGRRNLPPLHFQVEVRQSISSILDHSVRPTSCSAVGPSQPCYPQHSQLYVRDLKRHVLVPTTFYKTGWGHRPLTPAELGSAFDLPLWLPPTSDAHAWGHNHVMGARFVPIKIPAAVLGGAVPHLEPVYVHHLDRAGEKRDGPPPHSPLTPKRLRVSPPMDATTRDGQPGTRFAPIRAFLPHSAWLDDSLIATKATKADDAEAPYALWDGRIRGVFPWVTDRALAGFRTLGLWWWRRFLYRSFVCYVRNRFGMNWLSLLPAARQRQGGGGGGGGVVMFSLCLRSA